MFILYSAHWHTLSILLFFFCFTCFTSTLKLLWTLALQYLISDEYCYISGNFPKYIDYIFVCVWDTWWRTWLRHCAICRKVAGFDCRWWQWKIFIDIYLQPHYGLRGRLSLKQNVYQEYLPGGKDNVFTFMCRLSRNLGASNFWNPLGL